MNQSQSCFYFIFVRKNTIYYIYSISVSADMKNIISVFYRYRPIRKLSLLGFIGIGRYEKKLIGRTLTRPVVRKGILQLPLLFTLRKKPSRVQEQLK